MKKSWHKGKNECHEFNALEPAVWSWVIIMDFFASRYFICKQNSDYFLPASPDQLHFKIPLKFCLDGS
jgi:ssDNA-specific exonuclease RecJ